MGNYSKLDCHCGCGETLPNSDRRIVLFMCKSGIKKLPSGVLLCQNCGIRGVKVPSDVVAVTCSYCASAGSMAIRKADELDRKEVTPAMIKAAKKKVRWTHEDMAAHLGLTKAVVSQICNATGTYAKKPAPRSVVDWVRATLTNEEMDCVAE